jgi:hypothetical protein
MSSMGRREFITLLGGARGAGGGTLTQDRSVMAGGLTAASPKNGFAWARIARVRLIRMGSAQGIITVIFCQTTQVR